MNAINKPETRLLSLLVRQIRFEAIGINSYELVDPDGAELPAWDAGSHLDIHLPDGLIRQYSLCGDPADRRRYMIAVLKDENGRGGSRLLHETLQVQHIVNVSLPRNNFAIVPNAERFILIGGGIGITPLKAMAHELIASRRAFTLYYCAKGPQYAAFRDELGSLSSSNFHYDGGDPSQGLDIAGLLKDHAEATHLYYCGPAGLMAACARASAHWPQGTVHSEHFKAPVLAVAAGPFETAELASDNFSVEIASTGAVFDIPVDRSIVEVLGDAGIVIETSCVSGLCGTCKVKYSSGTVDHRDFILSDEEREDHLTTCVSRATSARLVLDL
jgi:vanillate O-demethylase ferredoxin subunit